VLAEATENLAEVAPLIAALLSISAGPRYPAVNLTAEAQKLRTFEALLGQVAGLAERRPVLMVIEDAHWIDPTTSELFGLVIDRIQHLPVLLLITFRPEFTSPWTSYAHLTSLTLSRLGQRQGVQMVERLTGGKPLPAEVLQQILLKTDGVPLFVEELTKTVLESGLLADAGDHYELSGPLPPLAIPTTLHDSLMARLDRLAPVKEMAQIGAVIGREFSHELLAAVAPMPANLLGDSLEQLVSSELVFRRGTPPEATYSFKHALVQDTAYQSLLKSRRQQLHARITEVLEEHFPEQTEAHPELLAHHCSQAGLADKAVDYWQRAGLRSISRSAMMEAMTQLTRGMEVLQCLPDGPDQQRRELGLQVALGQALSALKGYAAIEAGRAYARARELCEQVGDTPHLFPVLFGQWLFHFVRGELSPAREAGEQLLHLAEQQNDDAAQLAGYRAVASVLSNSGELILARRHLERLLALYDPAKHRRLAFLYGQDPQVVGRCWLARCLFALGCPAQALARMHEAGVEAEQLGHPYTVAVARYYRCELSHLLRNRKDVQEQAEALIAIGTERGFPFWQALGMVLQGWVRADAGEMESGIPLMRQGLAAYWATGGGHLSPYLLALLAEAHGKARQFPVALNVLGEALDKVETSGERWYEAELHRRRGELLLSLLPPWVRAPHNKRAPNCSHESETT
jgi:predicted ATPase